MIIINVHHCIKKTLLFFKVQEQQEEATQVMSTISQESNFTGK
jgi:hypothetical protein